MSHNCASCEQKLTEVYESQKRMIEVLEKIQTQLAPTLEALASNPMLRMFFQKG